MKTGAIILVSISVVLLIVITLGLGMIVNKEKTDQETESGQISFFLKVQDSRNQELLNGEYVITKSNGDFISRGILGKDSWTALGKVLITQLEVYCKAENHYMTRNVKEFTQIEIDSNASKFICKVDPIGDLKITHQGSLNKTESIINLNLTTNREFRKLSAVLSWTSGIIDVEYRQDFVVCDEELKNYTISDESGYIPLQEDFYLCKNELYYCKEVDGTKCFLYEEKMPDRFKNENDKAIYFGKTLKGEDQIILYVKTIEEKISEDYLEITFYDKELVYNIYKSKWELLDQYEGENLGAKDFKYTIFY